MFLLAYQITFQSTTHETPAVLLQKTCYLGWIYCEQNGLPTTMMLWRLEIVYVGTPWQETTADFLKRYIAEGERDLFDEKGNGCGSLIKMLTG